MKKVKKTTGNEKSVKLKLEKFAVARLQGIHVKRINGGETAACQSTLPKCEITESCKVCPTM